MFKASLAYQLNIHFVEGVVLGYINFILILLKELGPTTTIGPNLYELVVYNTPTISMKQARLYGTTNECIASSYGLYSHTRS